RVRASRRRARRLPIATVDVATAPASLAAMAVGEVEISLVGVLETEAEREWIGGASGPGSDRVAGPPSWTVGVVAARPAVGAAPAHRNALPGAVLIALAQPAVARAEPHRDTLRFGTRTVRWLIAGQAVASAALALPMSLRAARARAIGGAKAGPGTVAPAPADPNRSTRSVRTVGGRIAAAALAAPGTTWSHSVIAALTRLLAPDRHEGLAARRDSVDGDEVEGLVRHRNALPGAVVTVPAQPAVPRAEPHRDTLRNGTRT